MPSKRAGAVYALPHRGALLLALGAKEDGFALEHLDGQEERGDGVDARRRKNDCDVVPVIRADDELLAEKADVEDGDEGELQVEFDAREHSGDGGKDDDKQEWRDVTLRFLVAFRERGDGEEDGSKKNRQRKGHDENGEPNPM